MAGSVQEWTADIYKNYGDGRTAQLTESALGSGLYVMRGGGWMSRPDWVRTSYRVKRSPHSRNMDHGFRCAQGVPESSK